MFPVIEPATARLPPFSARVQGLDAIIALVDAQPEGARHGPGANPQAALAPTRVVDALVLDTDANGISTVEIGGKPLQVRLSEPQPKGAMVQLRLALTLPGAMQRAAEPVTLGPTARMLAALPAVSSSAAAPSLPPLNASPADPVKFAAALEHAVRASGVFYESHLSAWVVGQLPDIAMRTEALTRESGVRATSLPASGTDAATATHHSTNSSQTISSFGAAAPVAFDAITFEQLRCIEKNELRADIQVWPGQHAGIVLHVDDQPGRHRDERHPIREPAGSATLRLTLPHLGPVETVVRVCGAKVWLAIVAKDAEGAGLLQAHSDALAGAMTANGLTLIHGGVRHEA